MSFQYWISRAINTVRGILSDTNLIRAKISTWTCHLEQVVQGGGYTSRGLTIGYLSKLRNVNSPYYCYAMLKSDKHNSRFYIWTIVIIRDGCTKATKVPYTSWYSDLMVQYQFIKECDIE